MLIATLSMLNFILTALVGSYGQSKYLFPRANLVYALQIHQLFCFEADVFTPATALCTVVTILWTATSLDAEQCTSLDLTH